MDVPGKLHSKWVEKMWKLHSKRVEKTWNYTRNECIYRCGLCLFAMLILLFTGIFGAIAYALVKLHSKRVKKIENYTRNEWRRWRTTLETGEEDWKLHSKRVKKIENYTRNEWRTLSLVAALPLLIPPSQFVTLRVHLKMTWKITLATSGED